MKILMTGATGTVGKPLLKELLGMGHHVFCLVRPKGDLNGVERLERILGEPPDCGVVEGDITQVNCGLSSTGLELLHAFKPDVMLHVAADVRMDPKREAEIRSANILGTVNVLALARALGVKNVHYVSTAYVENGRSNPYEISKSEAEHVVMDSGLNYTISRISIVVGDSKTGEINGFTGYYGFFKPFVLMAQTIRQAANWMSYHWVRIPVSIKVAEGARLNLIPVDWTAMILAKITLRPAANRILQVVHPDPPLVIDVIQDTLNALRIEGVQIGELTDASDFGDKQMQAVYDRIMSVFEPYVAKTVQLDDSSLREFLADEYEIPSNFYLETFARLINYAVANNFGKK